jgi:hypothetical protein
VSEQEVRECIEPYPPYVTYEISRTSWLIIAPFISRGEPLSADALRRLRAQGVGRSEAIGIWRLERNRPEQCRWKRRAPPKEYAEAEYTKYYRYPSDGSKRSFEARGIFTIPAGTDPANRTVMDAISVLIDDAMIALGFEIYAGWGIGWVKEGVEVTGATTKTFRNSVRITVDDLRRRTQGPWTTNVTISEADLS